jgi:hypothetical protein
MSPQTVRARDENKQISKWEKKSPFAGFLPTRMSLIYYVDSDKKLLVFPEKTAKETKKA